MTTQTNCPFGAKATDSWLKVTPAVATGTTTLYVDVDPNMGGDRTSSAIIVGWQFFRSVSVKQADKGKGGKGDDDDDDDDDDKDK